MANADVKKQNSQTEEKGLQTRSQRGLSRRGWDPFSFATTSDLLGSDPFSWMRRFHDEMDRTFARFFGKEPDVEGGWWYPAIEVAQKDGQLQVHAELPGLKPEDVRVEVTDDALIIQGEKKYEHEDDEAGVYRSERRYGQFYREIPLPEGAKAEQAKAQFQDGVLEVVLPAPERKSNRREIPIESGALKASTSSSAQS